MIQQEEDEQEAALLELANEVDDDDGISPEM